MSITDDYVDLLADAVEIIAEAGRSLTATRLSRVPGDLAKPWRDGGTVISSWNCKGVFVEIKFLARFGFRVSTQDMEKRGTRSILVAAEPGCPDLTTYDEITDGSEKLRILSVDKLKPGAVTILYYFEVAAA